MVRYSYYHNYQLITKQIEDLRKRMIDSAKINGLHSPITVKISQDLDALLLLLIKEKNSKLFKH